MGRRPSVYMDEALCSVRPLRGGGPLCGEEALCAVEETLCVEKRPSARGGEPLFYEEASARRKPSVWIRGPLCEEEALWVGRRPSVQRGGPLCGEEALCAWRRPLRGGSPLCR